MIKPTRAEILRVAAAQSATDCGCAPADFFRSENVIVQSRVTAGARVYLKQPLACNLVSYGNNVVACVREDLKEAVRSFLNAYPVEHCFETPALHAIDAAFAPYGVRSRYMAEYFLPDPEKLKEIPCSYPVKILEPADFCNLYTPEWGNALCRDRSECDALCVGAYDGEILVGLAGVSADCETMWQIGVDVLPAYRRKGIASALTSRLALETFARGKIPFYCAAWCNLKSVGNALGCGFFPAWAELTFTETEKE